MKKTVIENNKLGVIIGVALGVLVFLFLAWRLTTPPTDKPEVVSVPVLASDHLKGDPTANITIVEYADFQCPACKAIQPILKQVLSNFEGKIKFVYRNFPLEQHKYALNAALAAEAAGKQGKYFEYGDTLYEEQTNWESGKDIDQLFDKYATDLGLDLNKFNTDRGSEDLKQKVAADQKSGMDVRVDSTPTFFVNGMKLKEFSLEGFEKLISQAGGTTKRPEVAVTIQPQATAGAAITITGEAITSTPTVQVTEVAPTN